MIAGGVAERVVHLFEMIEVQHREAEQLPVASRVFHFARERQIELAAVINAGETIACREVQQAGRCQKASTWEITCEVLCVGCCAKSPAATHV